MPRAREIERAVRDLEEWRPEAHKVLGECYLYQQADPTLPERWQGEGAEGRFKLLKLRSAGTFILYSLYLSD